MNGQLHAQNPRNKRMEDPWTWPTQTRWQRGRISPMIFLPSVTWHTSAGRLPTSEVQECSTRRLISMTRFQVTYIWDSFRFETRQQMAVKKFESSRRPKKMPGSRPLQTTRRAMYVWRNTKARSRNNRRGKAVSVTYWVCVSVALVIQHATRMRCIILWSVAWLALPYFSKLFHKRQDYEKKITRQNVFWFSV
jgi:hypothetical protein